MKEARHAYTLEELMELSEKFLATLDNDIPDERYTTDLGFAQIGIYDFLAYLDKREKQARRLARKLSRRPASE